ncbi:hypothetical protein BCR44DRAFT_1450249 [Catenaria anguillulae PL171]|uniref:Uncharacterized protein n=1 Tax=Catenaria anguillulae PL171 TaxID=765915 RepID=A0A1Y2H8V3_9FUNG|nr:hypothetical protein BCR44DRAFT_1450249 [Catenaria anguillulae PL171]
MPARQAEAAMQRAPASAGASCRAARPISCRFLPTDCSSLEAASQADWFSSQRFKPDEATLNEDKNLRSLAFTTAERYGFEPPRPRPYTWSFGLTL